MKVLTLLLATVALNLASCASKAAEPVDTDEKAIMSACAEKIRYAEQLIDNRKEVDAIPVLVECLDLATEIQSNSIDFIEWMLWEQLERLNEHPAAMEAMKARQAALQQALREDGVTTGRANVLETLNDALGESERTLAFYDALKPSLGPEALKTLRAAWHSELYNNNRYEDLALDITLPASVEECLQEFNDAKVLEGVVDDMKSGQIAAEGNGTATATFELSMSGDAEEEDWSLTALRESLTEMYEVLIAVGRLEDAAEVARRMLEVDASANTYNELAWAGFITGKPVPENLAQAEKAMELSNRRDVDIIDTYVRILNEFGRREEAKQEFDEAVRKAILSLQGNYTEGLAVPASEAIQTLELLRDDLIASGTLTAPPGSVPRRRE